MENKKKYTLIGEQLIQTVQVESGSTLVQETVIEPIIPELEPIIQEEIKEAPARIPNALFSSLLSTREYTNLKSLEKLGIDIKNKDIKEGVDEEGKPIRLTKLQDRILLALSAEFSRYSGIFVILIFLNKIYLVSSRTKLRYSSTNCRQSARFFALRTCLQ